MVHADFWVIVKSIPILIQFKSIEKVHKSKNIYKINLKY